MCIGNEHLNVRDVVTAMDTIVLDEEHIIQGGPKNGATLLYSF